SMIFPRKQQKRDQKLSTGLELFFLRLLHDPWRVLCPAIFPNEDRKRFSTSGILERRCRKCAAFFRLVGGRGRVKTCCAFGIGLGEFCGQRFHFGSQGQQIAVLLCSSDDFAFVGAGNFSDMAEMASIAVCAYRSVVQNPARRLVPEHPPGLTLAGVNEITCLIDSAVMVFTLVSECDY